METAKSSAILCREKFPNTGKYGPEITPYLDIFHAVILCRDILFGDSYAEIFKKEIYKLLG